jgi:micrococcal nuclease
MKKNAFIPVLILSLFVAVPIAEAQCWEGIVDQVVDGNTLLVSRGKTRGTVTLYGIVTPAPGQSFSAEAGNKLHTILLNKKITVCPQHVPVGNAAEVYVLSGYKLNVNEEMVRRGLAWSTVAQYKNLEVMARKKRLGLWSEDNPMPQNEYRRMAAERRSTVLTDDGQQGNVTPGSLSVYKSTCAPKPDRTDANTTHNESSAISMQRQMELEKHRKQQQQRTSDENLSHTDIDDVTIKAYFEYGGYRSDGLVEISLDYRNKALDRAVLWTDGDVNCDCSVTGHFNEGTNTRIARADVILTSHDDRLYIDIPYKYLEQDTFIELNSCTVECRISAGIFSLKASDKFYVYFPGIPYFLDNRPPFFDRPGHTAPGYHHYREKQR